MATKVLWVTKGLGPGGAERLLCAAARAHDTSRFRIECLFVVPELDQLADELNQAEVPTGCVSAFPGDWQWPRRLWSAVRSGGWDIIHVHSPLPGAVVRASARSLPANRRPRIITTEHNQPSTYHFATRIVNAATTRWDDLTIAVSDEVLRGFSPSRSEKVIKVTHGIDLDATKPKPGRRTAIRGELGLEDDEFVACIVANFRVQKDYPNLLRALHHLKQEGVDIRLVAVGHGPEEARVHSLCHSLGLQDRVVFTGPRPDAVEILAASDLFVLASRWEGLPVAAMEACAIGLPIVATSVGGMAEEFRDGENALLVSPNDPISLAGALRTLQENAVTRERLATAALAKAPDFDVALSTALIESLYETLVSQRPVPPGY